MDTISLGTRSKSAMQRPRRFGAGAVALLGQWLTRARTRRSLRLLADNPQALADLGLSRDQVEDEAMKPFWR